MKRESNILFYLQHRQRGTLELFKHSFVTLARPQQFFFPRISER
jgi:hypothetical protein